METKTENKRKPIQRGLAILVHSKVDNCGIDYVRMVLNGKRDGKSKKAKEILNMASKILSI